MKYILTNVPNFIVDKDYKINKTTGTLKGGDVATGSNSGNCMFWESTKKIIQNQTSCELLHPKTFNENKEK